MQKPLARAFLAISLVLAFVLAQATGTLAGTTGSIQGKITDATGNAVAGATVTIVAPSYSTKTTTGADGFYAITGVPPDTYLVTISKQGYQSVSVPGVTVTQDQTASINSKLQKEVKLLGKVAVRATTSLIQPTTTADVYTVSAQNIQQITGTPQNIAEATVLNAQPGFTTDNAGYPIIRGAAENEEGYALEGIDATDAITGQFINSLSLAGESRIVVLTGGYDVSNGNTNAGVVNEVIKRGAYPGAGQLTLTSNFPNFDHRLAFEYGNATSTNRFSYFIAYNGLRQYRVYGDTTTFLPRLVGSVGDATGNEDVINLFYRWGSNNENELQYLGEHGANLFDLNFGIDPKTTPYATNNCLVDFSLGGSCFAPGPPYTVPPAPDSLADFTTLFPGQVGLRQNIGYPDHENNNHSIQKLNFKRQFGPASFANIRLFRTDEKDIFLFPWDGGAFGDEFEHNISTNWGGGFDYTNQLNSKHQMSFGGDYIYTRAHFDLGLPSLEPFTYPFTVCYIALLGPCFGNGTPLVTYPEDTGLTNDPLRRYDLWLSDKWTPSDRWRVSLGFRWDQEIITLPGDAAAQNHSFYVDSATGNVIETLGPQITTAVTKPSQLSPRIAVSYQANERDVFRASYGKNIEFTPFSNIEFKANIPTSLAACDIASGCFVPLPGYSPSCVVGSGTCNSVANLYQQAILEYNTNFFAQYTPVKPQRATNFDASWEHDFGGGWEMKLTPYYRKGDDYVVANTPLLFTLPDGTPVFGAPREENAGFNKNFGVEFSGRRDVTYGWGGFLNGTWGNTFANYDSDFFPSVNNAALAAGHVFHASYYAAVTATGNIYYASRNGFHFNLTMPYESGYRYGVGKKTFVFPNACGDGTSSVPTVVLNTDLAQACLGRNANTSAYYFTDPVNPGTVTHPNITGSRGTPDGDDPGTLKGPQRIFFHVSFAQDFGQGSIKYQAGVRINNILGNYTNAVVGGNSRYRNNGLGGYGPSSGTNTVNPLFEPYQFARSPFPFEAEATGPARLFTLFLNAKF